MLGARCRYVSRSLPIAARAKERTRIQLCGRLSVEIDGVQFADGLRGKQVPLLLAYLLLNRTRHVGREELIGALWPDHAPISQDAALRTLLSRLRSALGADALVGRDELILDLPHPVWIDLEAAATEVERAQQALAAGDARTSWALAQVPLNIAGRGLLPGAQALWLEPRRRELEDVRLQALEVVGRSGLIMGGTQLASAARAARTLIDSEPYRESGYVLLMETLEAEGNVAEALRVFDGLRTLLRDELGTSPSPDMMAVHERLLRPGKRAGGEDGRSSPRPRPHRAAQRARRPWGGAAGRTQARARTAAASVVRRPRPGAAPARGQRQGRAVGRGSRDRQDAAGRGCRRGRIRRRGVGARRALARGGAGSLPAVSRGAPPLRPQRPLLATAGERARVRRRAGATDPRAPAPGSRPSGAGRRRAGDRALPAVRGRRGAARRDVGASAGAARARRPPVGRPADAPAAAPSRAGTEPGAAADPGRVPGDRGDRQRIRGRARRAAPRAARDHARYPRPGRARDRGARAPADGDDAVALVLARAARRDRGQPVLRRGDRPPSRRGRRADGHRRRARAPAVRAARGGQGRDREAAGPARRPGDGLAARGGGDRPRRRRGPARAGGLALRRTIS